jgi:hypothetical protein
MAQDATDVEGSEHDALAPPFLLSLATIVFVHYRKGLGVSHTCFQTAQKRFDSNWAGADRLGTSSNSGPWCGCAARRTASTTFGAVTSAAVTSAFLQNPRQSREQQQELFDESVRRQEEKLLLSRIQMYSITQEYVHSYNDWSVREQSERVLLQEADKSGRTSWNINAKTRNIKTLNDWVRNKK